MRFRAGRITALAAVAGAVALIPQGAGLASGQTTGATAKTSTAAWSARLSSAQVRTLSQHVTDKVIVVMRNQAAGTPDTRARAAARKAIVSSLQAPLLRELKQVHARNLHSVDLVNAVVATVSSAEASRLAKDPAVARVVKDEPIPLAATSPGTVVSAKQLAHIRTTSSNPGGSLADACLPNGQVQLDPQAVETIHAASQSGTGATAQALGYTGAGVKVAFIADGIDINDPDFIRPNGQPVFVDYEDFSGTGTNSTTGGGEAFLDASSIAAQGEQVYNVGDATGTNPTCNIRILGVAPGASLVGLDVFGGLNVAFNSVFLEAINYAVNVDHVNVINESFGGNPFPDSASLDLTRQADDAAVAAGVTVTASTGDAGVTNTIGSPATDPAVISAGASTTYRAYAQVGAGAINLPGVTGWEDDNISALSSAGEDQAGGTVDVVAPGDLNWALCSSDPIYLDCAGQDFTLSGGTSEASPLTAGTAALVIQAYEESHGGAAPTPAVVKQIIVSTAQNIDAPGDQQGAGMIDAYQAVKAAAAYTGTTATPNSQPLLDGSTQLNAAGPERAVQTFNESVTNLGTKPATVGLSSRTLGTYRTLTNATVTLADASKDLAVVRFNVPAGQARLDGSIAWQSAADAAASTDFAAAVNVSLFDPQGRLAEYSLPQGNGNYGDAQVADPSPGRWTAVIFSSPSTEGGFTGPVLFGARSARWTSFGHLSSSKLVVPAGGTSTYRLTVADPAQPGDQAGSILLTNSSASPAFTAVTSVPVTLRSYVPTPAPRTTFTGTLTGGNGREAGTGVSEFYQFTVPAGTKALNADITTGNSANTFLAELVDPSTQEAASTATSNLQGTSVEGQPVTVAEVGTQLHVLKPAPGLWTLDLDFYNQVSGTSLSQPFTVSLDDVPVAVGAPGLPDSASSTLPAGKAVTVPVTVTNRGNTPEAYFVDGRLDTTTTLNLASLTSSQTPVPIPGESVPAYLVPTHTTSITASATAPAPIFFDYSYAFGDPDLISSSTPYSDTASGTFNSANVAAGQWTITPFQDGPDGANGVPTVTAQTSLSATTLAFDPAVSAPTGDLWQAGVNPDASFTPYVVDPGQTVTIPVTITPNAPVGSTVSGTLYVGDASAINDTLLGGTTNIVPEGSDLAALSYEYTVGK